MKLSARNQLQGVVKAIKEGAVMAEVVVQLPGGQEVVAAITMASVQNLQLKVGSRVFALIKSTDVLIGTDE
jgi:molybdopterin-binding protein